MSAAGRPALARWGLAVTAAFALGGITVSAWGPRLPAVEASLGAGPAALGLLLAGVTVGGIAGLVAAAPLLRSLGRRRALAGSIWLFAAGLGLMGLADAAGSVPLIAAAFVVTGAGIGVLDVLINVEGAAVERAAGRTLLPMMHAAWSLGVAAGSGVGAACAALGVTPAAQFAGEAVVIAAAGVVIAAGIPAGRPGPGSPDSPDSPGSGRRRDRAAALRRWLRGWADWRLLLIGTVMFGCELGEGSADSWLPLAARTGHGQGPAAAALLLTLFAACEALARIAAGPVVDRLGRAWATRLTTALGVAGIAAFILGGSTAMIVAGVAAWAVGVSTGFPLGMSAAAESGSAAGKHGSAAGKHGPGPAARISVVATIGYFANIAGPPAVGALAASAGLLGALWAVALLFGAAFAAAGSLGRLRRRDL
jgi:MFS family permease